MSTNQTKERPFFAAAKNRPEVIAHRGGAGEWPAETMFAFEQVFNDVDVLELDVRRTKDDEIVLMHNCTINETTDGTGCVRKLTMPYLQGRNAAARWATNPIFKSIPIPKLSDVIDLMKKYPTIRVNIEIKPRDRWLALEVGRMISEAELENRVLIASAWNSVLKTLRDKYERIATSASVLEIMRFQLLNNLLGFGYGLKTDAIQWHSRMFCISLITRSFVQKAKSLDLKVHAWTVNQPEEMARMIELGVDGIITDHPTTLRRILNR